MSNMVEKRTWEEFREIGLLWWVNRILHTFGWAIVVEVDKEDTDGPVQKVYPARVKFRGFDESSETQGFKRLSAYMAVESPTLCEEAMDDGTDGEEVGQGSGEDQKSP